MSDDPEPPRRRLAQRWSTDPAFRRLVAGVGLAMVLGLAVRVGFVLVVQDEVQLTGGDAYWYHFQAKLVADGKGFLDPFEYFKEGRSVPGGDHPPGVVLVLAAADLAGVDSPQGQRLLMALLGTASIGVIGALGHRLAGNRAAITAALLAAIYPNIWVNDGMLMSETLFVAGISVALLCCYRVIDRPNRWEVVGLSAALTVAAMARPETAALFPFLVVPLLLARRENPWRERVAQVAVAAVVPLLAFGPWAAYNASRFEQPVVVSTGAGQTLAVANCDLTYSGTFKGFYNISCLKPPYIDPPTSLDGSVRDPEYRRLALEYMREHRGELPGVMVARVGRLWHLYKVEDSLNLDGHIEGRAGGAPGGSLRIVREALWMYYLLLPFAVAGCILLRRRRVPIYPLLSQPLLATVVAAMTFGVTRYRVGSDVVAVVLAGVAVDAGLAALGRSRRRALVPPAAPLPG